MRRLPPLRVRFALLSSTLGAALALGCTPAIGTCDEEVGERLVVDREGRVVYAGQAILNGSCGSGRCHSEAAVGSQRSGVPRGLDFDLPVGTVDSIGRPDPTFIDRLTANASSVQSHRESIWREVHRGNMPPFDEDIDGKAPGGYRFVEFDLGRCAIGEELPASNTAAGQDVLRSWLACGAPVVEASDPALANVRQGDIGIRTPVCEDDSTGTGDLFTRVYDDVISVGCVIGCHAPDGDNPELDLSTAQAAFTALTTQGPNGTEDCSVSISGQMVDTANPDASYLLHKLGDPTIPAAQRPICGRVMPSGQPALVRGTAAVRAWIEAGAPAPAP